MVLGASHPARYDLQIWATPLDLLAQETRRVKEASMCSRSRNVARNQPPSGHCEIRRENGVLKLRNRENACDRYPLDSKPVQQNASPEQSPSSLKTRKNENIFSTGREGSPLVESITYVKRAEWPDHDISFRISKAGARRRASLAAKMIRLRSGKQNGSSSVVSCLWLVKSACRKLRIVHFADGGVSGSGARISEFDGRENGLCPNRRAEHRTPNSERRNSEFRTSICEIIARWPEGREASKRMRRAHYDGRIRDDAT